MPNSFVLGKPSRLQLTQYELKPMLKSLANKTQRLKFTNNVSLRINFLIYIYIIVARESELIQKNPFIHYDA